MKTKFFTLILFYSFFSLHNSFATSLLHEEEKNLVKKIATVVNKTESDSITQTLTTASHTVDLSTIDINEDVPGCADNYFRSTRVFWLVGEGWCEFLSTIASSTSTLLMAVVTADGLDPDLRKKLGIAAVTLGGACSFLQMLKNYSQKAAKDSEQRAREVIALSPSHSRKQ